jgi:predicted methyltransferase
MYYLVLVGSRPFAIYTSESDANTAKSALADAGLKATPSVVAVVLGGGDFSETCNQYLKCKSVIESTTVASLDAA